MTETDQKATVSAFNQLVRGEHARHRVHWRPSSSSDPDVQRADRDSLNDALRIAAGRDPQHAEEEPEGTFPWRSLEGPE
jgi:hypothetical protein